MIYAGNQSKEACAENARNGFLNFLSLVAIAIGSKGLKAKFKKVLRAFCKLLRIMAKSSLFEVKIASPMPQIVP